MTIRAAILGLDRTGQSFGLALANALKPIERVGSDEKLLWEKAAVEIGALDKAIHNLHDCVENADIVVLGTAYKRSLELVEALKDVFKPGSVILYTGRMPLKVKELASRILPPDRYLVGYYPGGNLSLTGYADADISEASVDLFRKSHVLIAADPQEPGEAVKLAADFSTIIGAVPVFTDPAEAQGLITLGVHFPKFLASLGVANITGQPGWEDARKIAGAEMLGLASPITLASPDENFADELADQSYNLMLLLDSFMDQAEHIRRRLRESEAPSVTIDKAKTMADLWIERRSSNNWAETTAPELPSMRQWLGRLVGLGGRKRDEGKRKH